MAHVGDHLGIGAAAGDQRGRVGRQVVQQQKGHERHAEQDRGGLEQAFPQKQRHQPRPRWVGSSRSRSASPTRLNDKAVSRMMAPGMNTSQGALWK